MSFVKRCMSFCSYFHPSHPKISIPYCTSSPKGFSALLLQGGCPLISEISRSVCSHHRRDVQACLTLMAAFVTTKDISGLFLNCDATLEWWTQRNGSALANCSTAGLQDFQANCNIILECFPLAAKLRHEKEKNCINTMINDSKEELLLFSDFDTWSFVFRQLAQDTLFYC